MNKIPYNQLPIGVSPSQLTRLCEKIEALEKEIQELKNPKPIYPPDPSKAYRDKERANRAEPTPVIGSTPKDLKQHITQIRNTVARTLATIHEVERLLITATEADMVHAVACVNALAGIDPAALGAVITSAHEAAKAMERCGLIVQADNLRSALAAFRKEAP